MTAHPPEFPIVDTHVHLWNPGRFRMSWIDGNEVLDRAYELNDYRDHAREVDVEAVPSAIVGPADQTLEQAEAIAGAQPYEVLSAAVERAIYRQAG